MTLPTYHQAVYRFAPGFLTHVQEPSGDRHALLTPHIKLAKPLNAKDFPRVYATARAINAERPCIFFCPWHPSPLAKVYFCDEIVAEATYLMIFQQPKKGLTERFRLLVFALEQSFPKSAFFYNWLKDELARLPPLDAD